MGKRKAEQNSHASESNGRPRSGNGGLVRQPNPVPAPAAPPQNALPPQPAVIPAPRPSLPLPATRTVVRRQDTLHSHKHEVPYSSLTVVHPFRIDYQIFYERPVRQIVVTLQSQRGRMAHLLTGGISPFHLVITQHLPA